jgi:8-amino-7-oxononanoate synthase
MSLLDRRIQRHDQQGPQLVERFAGRDGLIAQRVEAVRGARVRIGGRWALNFAATNYLGLARDPTVRCALTDAAGVWGTSLATPRLLAVDRLTERLEAEIAVLVGQERALVFASTTHAALDVLPLLAGQRGVLYVDGWAYPISTDGASLAARHGARLLRFPHDDRRALEELLAAHAGNPDPVIVCDGVYPAAGEPARLREIAATAQPFGAALYVDDAHGIGLLGEHPTAAAPYGHGGGGVLRYLGLAGDGATVHVGSFSKAFGVPIAFAAGPAGFITYLRATASSHIHSSPPALPIVAAALAALHVNHTTGDTRRQRLAATVRRFRDGCQRTGIVLTSRGLFPVQSIGFATPQAATDACLALRRAGIWAVLQLGPPENPHGGAIRFVLTAEHTEADIDCALAAFAHRVNASPFSPRRLRPARRLAAVT